MDALPTITNDLNGYNDYAVTVTPSFNPTVTGIYKIQVKGSVSNGNTCNYIITVNVTNILCSSSNLTMNENITFTSIPNFNYDISSGISISYFTFNITITPSVCTYEL